MRIRKPILTIAIGAVLLFWRVGFGQGVNIYTFSGDFDLGVNFTQFISSGQHYIGARGDTVYVVTAGGSTFCQKSVDGGQSFGPAVLVASGGVNPSMRVDTAGIIYVAYQKDADIYFSKSTDGGQTFIPGVKVNDDTIPQVGQEKPSIAVNNKGQVFVVWADKRTSPPSTFATASYDGGLTFTPNAQVNEPGTGGSYADIAADDSGRVYVLYGGILGGRSGSIVARSTDSGQNFIYRVLASDPPWIGGADGIALLPGGIVGIVWLAVRISGDTLHENLRFSISHNYAQTFSPSVQVQDDPDLSTTGDLQAPSLALQNEVFYLVWRDVRFAEEGDHISFTYSSDLGRSFAPVVNVTPFFTARLFPSLAVNEQGKAFVSWLDARNDLSHGLNYHTFTAHGEPDFVKGDLNLDGLLTIVDVTMELNAVFLGLPFPAPYENADSNCDSFLTSSDVVLHVNATFLISPFPCN